MDLQSTGPPAYSDQARPPNAPASAVPPAYDNVNESASKDQLVASELVTLVLDDCIIYPAGQPDRPLFRLSTPPLSGRRTIYSMEKMIYRLSTTDGEGTIRQRTRHIYDFWSPAQSDVPIHSRAVGQTAVKETVLRSRSGWNNSCRAADRFKARRSMKQRLHGGSKMEWEDTKVKKLIAVEPEVNGEDGQVPRLEMKTTLSVEDFDLLVTCWAGRLFRLTRQNLEGSLSVDKSKLETPELSWTSNTHESQ